MARIAFVLPDFGGGGAERVALTLIRAFVARGHDIDLVLMQAEGALLSELPAAVRLFDLNAPGLRATLTGLRDYLRAERPDAIQASMWPLTVTAIVARRLARSSARLVVSDHTTLSIHYGGSWRLRAALRLTTRFFYPRADARIIVSERAADDLARISGLDRSAIVVVYNPIDRPTSPISNEDADRIWSGRGDARILSVGALKAVKNFPLLIRAFARVAARRPARLIIVGEGKERDALAQLAGQEGVGDRVVLAGYAADPWPYYRSAELFVLASDYEGFGNVLVEAMAVGTKVVSTDCESGPGEILDGGRFGTLVPCGDAEALAAGIDSELDKARDPEMLKARAQSLSGDDAIERYLRLLLPDEGERR